MANIDAQMTMDELRRAFASDSIAEKNLVIRKAYDLIDAQLNEIEGMQNSCDKSDSLADYWFTEYEKLRDALVDIVGRNPPILIVDRTSPTGDNHG